MSEKQLDSLLENIKYEISLLSNSAAFIYQTLNDVSWAGFYLYQDNQLILGPFQGMPACVHIQMGKGVCGTAAKEEKAQIVPNVHEFAGHIACDSASNSEIVVPIFKDEKLWGVFDFDSTKLDNFDETDQKYLTEIADAIFD